MSCKTIKVKKITTTNTTTAETVEGVFVFEDINFPANPTTGSIHIVKFDDGLYIYEFINFVWSLKITHLDNVGKTHSIGDSEDDYSGQFPAVDGEVIGDTYTIQYADGIVVCYRWDGTVWLDIFIQSTTVSNEIVNGELITTVNGVESIPLDIREEDSYLISFVRANTIPQERILIKDEFKEGWFLYDPTDTTSVDNTGTVLVDASGKRFKRVIEDFVNVKWFGALGDNIQDDQPSIQAAVNYGITYKHKVYIPIGIYKINSPILIASDVNNDFNNEFINFELEGENKPTIANSSTTINANFNNAFAIGIQKGKGVKISNLHIIGQNTLNFTPKQSFDNLESQWVVNGCRDERYSPYAGLIIDPFGNSLPPDGGYPGFSNYYQQIGNGGSTGIDLHNIDITGFVVGFAFSINGNTQNSDQINVENPKIYNCKSGMAFGQSQTKGISVNNIMCWGSTRFLFDGLGYGVGNGFMPNIDGGTIAGGVRSLVRFASSWTPLNVQNLFAEYI